MSSDPAGSELYREEAIEHRLRDPDSYGVLKTPPLWTWAALLTSVAFMVAAGIFVSVAKLDVFDLGHTRLAPRQMPHDCHTRLAPRQMPHDCPRG